MLLRPLNGLVLLGRVDARAAVPAFLRLAGAWEQVRGPAALVLAVGALVVFTVLHPRLTPEAPAPGPALTSG